MALDPVAMTIFSSYGRPRGTVEVDVYNPQGWLVEVGDVVSVTHSYIPNFNAGGLGVSAEPMRVISKTDMYSPNNEPFSRLKLMWFTDVKAVEYVPCLRLSAASDISGSPYKHAVAADEDSGGFSSAGSSKKI